MIKHKKPITLWHLVYRQRCAPTVYMGLLEIARRRGANSFVVTRNELSKICNVSPDGITKAFVALEGGGWIKREHIRIRRDNGFVSKVGISIRKWRVNRIDK